ncbi:MAG: gliding motility-associated C-terminal domain-containing protein, partial [Candidatus Saccharibacteria bacterium]|nr:gliding motility-associated C-terminal domain-containing protein [Candidatus Saccharibacteria bacterium]
FDTTTCAWVNDNTPQPAAPAKVNCWDTFTFNTTTCAWDVTGTQPTAPVVFCYQTATWNPSLCDYVVTGTQPVAPIIPSEACNADSTPIDLDDLLPVGIPTNGVWINQDNVGILQGSIFNPLDATLGNHIFEYKVTDGNCPLSIKIDMNINFDCKVLGVGCEAIVVHKAFTPNGDGINEQLVIDGVDSSICYPSGINVEIYNRWGVLVFETSKYDNTNNAFEGYSKGRTTISQSDGLPTGTYFYILNYESFDGSGNIQMNRKDGFIYLSR